ncbi:MAG: hypothetical protein KBG84_08735 [Planctomycetes bacterium]|nr:hypothetical protein [Planctomycetota bacterium]
MAVLLTGAKLFGVRHHSPRCSSVLVKWLAREKPRAVLIEGPSDATHLIEILAEKGTQPPVAILAYRKDGTPGSCVWPFASYSPEYAALSWAVANKVPVEFIDIPAGIALAEREAEDETHASEAPRGEARPEPTIYDRCAQARGYRTFEEFWEAAFEAPDYDPQTFVATLDDWADLTRQEGDLELHRARDAFMARRISEAVAKHRENVAAVLGAAHTAALARGDFDSALEAKLPAPLLCETTLIPYSFPRLSEQLGYGAGNRAPQYYQRAHDNDCDFKRATLEVLIEFCGHLRLRGFAASLADTIEAYRLALMLAQLREKQAPGLDEVRDAALAVLCRGEKAHIDGFLWPSVVGKNIGRVAGKIGRNSLQEEFWGEVKARRLPSTDEMETFSLRLNNEVEIASSIFLHRLRVAGIPYANFVGAARSKAGEAQAGGIAALTRVSEGWQAQWTPSTDIALVEKIVLGENLTAVCRRVLEDKLTAARSTGEAADVLLESVVAGVPATLAAALEACETRASADDDVFSLARASRALSGLLTYGSSRSDAGLSEKMLAPLCQATFTRSVLRLENACKGDDEAVKPALEAMRLLHETAQAQPLVDKPSWLDAARGLSGNFVVNAQTSGMAAGLLYLAQALTDADAAALIAQRLSNTAQPENCAGFLEGFLNVNATVIVKSRPVVAALDAFLCSLEIERFKNSLPALRRALGPLGATERRYLLENLVALRNLGGGAQAARAIVVEKDKQKLKEMNADLGKVMDDLDDLL